MLPKGIKNNKLWSWVPWDSDLRKAALAMPGKNWKAQTRLLVKEDAPHQQTRNCKKKNDQRENGKNWSQVPCGCLVPRWTGRQTVGCNIALTLPVLYSSFIRNVIRFFVSWIHEPNELYLYFHHKAVFLLIGNANHKQSGSKTVARLKSILPKHINC
jgi:hypothetical protein